LLKIPPKHSLFHLEWNLWFGVVMLPNGGWYYGYESLGIEVVD
jgi:hypothetical protein